MYVDPHKLYEPKGGADLLWRCRKPEVLIDGPAGTGKTRGVLEKVVLAALKYPHSRILISRKTRASMTQTVLVTLEEHVLPAWDCFGNIKRAQRESYRFPNGSEVVVAGWDKPTRILSGEYDMFVYHQAEEATEDEWEAGCTRLRWGAMPYQQAIAECNPGPPEHWLLKRVERRQTQRILSRHQDNPAVTAEYLERLRTTLTGHRLQRLYYGKWVAAEGLVYEDYDEAVHRIRRQGPWARYIIGVDDGYTNPLAAHLYAIDGDGRMHAIREFYRTKVLAEEFLAEWAEPMRRAVRKAGGRLEAVVVDPSAKKLMATLAQAGFPVVPADNAVADGLRTVASAVKVNGDGRPRLTVDPRHCPNLNREFGLYEWARGADGQQKDVPVKKNDHAMDELRYALRYVEATSGSLEVIAV